MDLDDERGMYYDREGNELRYSEYSTMVLRQRENGNYADYKRVAETTVEVGDQSVWVSTVWLGLNHAYGGGPPMIFETMPFGGQYDGEAWRYSTETEARKGHEEVVEMVRKSLEGC